MLFRSIGGEFRWENYKLEAGEPESYLDGGVPILDGPNKGNPASTGSQVFPGFSPKNAQDESRTNEAIYVDLENNVTPRWTIGIAGRYENYSDFGSTASGKLATRYQLTPGFAIRGAISNGFRAPALAQAFFSSIATNFIGGVPFEIGTFPVNTPVAKALGAKPLKAEKSINTSLGFMLFNDNFTLTVDAYNISITDRIVLTSTFHGGDVQAFLAAKGIQATGGRYFTNVLDTRTQGIDLTARYGVHLSNESSLRLTIAFNANTTDVRNPSEISTPAEIKAITNIPTMGKARQSGIEHGQPNNSWRIMGNYNYKNWGINVKVLKFGSITTFSVDENRDQTYSPVWTTGLELSYKINRFISLAVGSNNVFDIYPDKTLKRNSFNGIFQYSSSNPSGYNGRYIYSRLSVSL